jgi:hypothetical protein
MANSDDIIMRRILQDLEVFTSQYRIRNKWKKDNIYDSITKALQ